MSKLDRPEVPWFPVDTHPLPRGEKIMGLTKYGVLLVGDLGTANDESTYIVCWQHLPRKPKDWDQINERLGIK